MSKPHLPRAPPVGTVLDVKQPNILVTDTEPGMADPLALAAREAASAFLREGEAGAVRVATAAGVPSYLVVLCGEAVAVGLVRSVDDRAVYVVGGTESQRDQAIEDLLSRWAREAR